MLLQGGLKWEQGAEPPPLPNPAHFNHWLWEGKGKGNVDLYSAYT